MSGFWRLAVRADFSAAHALRHYQGKCENPHGHNFTVEACVEGDKLDAETGMLLDFGILKRALSDILAPLDHADLNATPPFDEINPSSENLAKHIGTELASFLAENYPRAARLRSLAVSEKPAQTAVWFPD